MGVLRRQSLPEAWLLLVVGLCILAAVLADVVYFAGRPRTTATATAANAQYPLPGVTGAVQLHGHGTESLSPAAATVGAPCKGLDTFDDLLGGTPVVVTDQGGKAIATGALDIGKVANGSTCEFAFYVPDVPKAGSYRFEVGNRPVLDSSYDAIAAQGWQVTLALG
jgi:hypothetical protein